MMQAERIMSDGIPAFMAPRRRSGVKRSFNLNRQFDRGRVYGFWDAVPDPGGFISGMP